MGDILRKVRIPFSALRAALVNTALRRLLLSELLAQEYKEGESVVVPQGMRFQPIPAEQFAKYKQTLSGLNSDNANQVRQKLVEQGLKPGFGIGLPGDNLEMKGDPDLKRLRTQAVGQLGEAVGNQYAALVDKLAALGSTQMPPGGMEAPPAPQWAGDLHDRRHLLRFDATQYVAPVGVNGRLTMCIVDTGAHRTVMDLRMAQEMGLEVRSDVGNCGRFSVPGSEAVHAYAGIVPGDTELRLNNKVIARVRNMRIIKHPHPFMLLGADVLRGGRPFDSWNFAGIDVDTLGLNEVDAHLKFVVAGDKVRIPLPHAPAGALMFAARATAYSGG